MTKNNKRNKQYTNELRMVSKFGVKVGIDIDVIELREKYLNKMSS